MGPGMGWCEEKLEGVEGEETPIRIHYVRKKSIFNKGGNKYFISSVRIK